MFVGDVDGLEVNFRLDTNGRRLVGIAISFPIYHKRISMQGYMAEGYYSKEIAKHLSISINTVNNPHANIMKKLNIQDAVGLTKYAINLSLLVNADRNDI